MVQVHENASPVFLSTKAIFPNEKHYIITASNICLYFCFLLGLRSDGSAYLQDTVLCFQFNLLMVAMRKI